MAVTAFAAFIVTTQLPVPVQAPDQPEKTEFAPGRRRQGDGRAVVVGLRAVGAAVDPGPGSTPPVPPPAFETDSVCVASANVAVTDVAASIVTSQLSVPLHAPDHPVKVEFAAGRRRQGDEACPARSVSAQSEPQSIPPGST